MFEKYPTCGRLLVFAYSSSDHRYLIAKAYITFYNENPRQRIRGILIDVDSGWTFSINPERLDYFVQTGDRTYLPQPPNLDPKVPEKPYADSGLTANVSPNFNITRWPDGRILNHPEHFVRTCVIKEKSGYTLILRSGPGSRFESIREIPRDGTGLIAFDQDRVWDGDTWWYPIEWQGLRSYIGRSFLGATD